LWPLNGKSGDLLRIRAAKPTSQLRHRLTNDVKTAIHPSEAPPNHPYACAIIGTNFGPRPLDIPVPRKFVQKNVKPFNREAH
jgi:hypothetical protein